MSLIVISDLHGDFSTDGYERFDDLRNVLGKVEEKAREGDQLICLGDVSNPFSRGVHRVSELMVMFAKSLTRVGCPSIWLTGNHDVVEDRWGSHSMMALRGMCRAGDDVIVHDKPMVSQLGPYVVVSLPYVAPGFAYDPAGWIEDAAGLVHSQWGDEAVGKTIVAGHLMIEGIEPGSETTDMARGRDVFWPEEAVKKHFPDALWLNGHYHRRQVFRGIHIPGSLLRLTHGEEENEPAYLVFD